MVITWQTSCMPDSGLSQSQFDHLSRTQPRKGKMDETEWKIIRHNIGVNNHPYWIKSEWYSWSQLNGAWFDKAGPLPCYFSFLQDELWSQRSHHLLPHPHSSPSNIFVFPSRHNTTGVDSCLRINNWFIFWVSRDKRNFLPQEKEKRTKR